VDKRYVQVGATFVELLELSAHFLGPARTIGGLGCGPWTIGASCTIDGAAPPSLEYIYVYLRLVMHTYTAHTHEMDDSLTCESLRCVLEEDRPAPVVILPWTVDSGALLCTSHWFLRGISGENSRYTHCLHAFWTIVCPGNRRTRVAVILMQRIYATGTA
jgi:hypothetical protein